MTDARSLFRAGACAVSLCVFLAGGCAASRTIHGKVVHGPAGVVTLVSANDPRLANAGPAGVHLRISEGDGPGSITEVTTSGDGSFKVRIPEAIVSRRLGVHATGEQIMPLHASSYLPGDDRRLLVVVEPRSSMEGDGR